MIGYVMVGTNDLDRAIIFYDEVLKILDLERKDTDEICAGYSQKGGDGTIEFLRPKALPDLVLPAVSKTVSGVLALPPAGGSARALGRAPLLLTNWQ